MPACANALAESSLVIYQRLYEQCVCLSAAGAHVRIICVLACAQSARVHIASVPRPLMRSCSHTLRTPAHLLNACLLACSTPVYSKKKIGVKKKSDKITQEP